MARVVLPLQDGKYNNNNREHSRYDRGLITDDRAHPARDRRALTASTAELPLRPCGARDPTAPTPCATHAGRVGSDTGVLNCGALSPLVQPPPSPRPPALGHQVSHLRLNGRRNIIRRVILIIIICTTMTKMSIIILGPPHLRIPPTAPPLQFAPECAKDALDARNAASP